ncbi:hypothetical protein IJ425_07060 [bacterium]|nr:hypothetical protein [bacterium]
MAEKRMTKREMFAQIMGHLNDVEEIAFIEKEIARLDAKASNTKPSAKQVENEALRAAIVEFMVPGEKYAVNELMVRVPELAAINATNQRVSALLKPLADAGVVVKTYEKRKPFFGLPEE